MIFLDTSNINEIKRFHNMGIIRGVTTNPSIMRADNSTWDDLSEIARYIYPYPVSIEVLTNIKTNMLSEAVYLTSKDDNIVVKIPIHGPNGELDNIDVIHELESKFNIRVNATAMMSAQQGYLAAIAGATYVSLFGGRINNMGYDAKTEISRLRKLLDFELLNSKIIVGSVREVLNIIDWTEAGADYVTVVPSLLEKMFINPYTKETVQQFLKDSLVQ